MKTVLPKTLVERFASIWSAVVVAVSVLAIYVGASVSSVAVFGPSSDAQGGVILFFPLFIAVAVLIHEVGHAVAAWSVGWNVHAIIIGPLAYRVRLRKFMHISRAARRGYGGLVLSTPPPNRNWDTGWGTILFGGPLANFLALGLAMCAAFIFRDEPRWPGLLAGFAFASFVMGVGNLVPVARNGKWRSDGGKLLAIFLKQPVSATNELIARLQGLSFDGVAPQDWDATIVQKLKDGSAGGENRPVRDLFLLNYYLATGSISEAYNLLERSEAAVKATNPHLAIERAFLCGLVKRDADQAAKILSTIPEVIRRNSFQYWRAMAVVCGLQSQTEAAHTAIVRAREAARKAGLIPDADDDLLFSAIEKGDPIPSSFDRPIVA